MIAAQKALANGHASHPELDTEIARLEKLSAFEREREIKTTAKSLEVSVSFLRAEIKRRLPAVEDDPAGQGEIIKFPEPDLWSQRVSGAELLDDLVAFFLRYAALPEHAAEALAFWCLHAWTFEASFITPRLAITSPGPRCGKSTVLRMLRMVVPRPFGTSNATTAALFRLVQEHRPCVLLDEADTFLPENEDLRGLLNSGYERDGGFIRTVGDDHEPRMFSTWCPVAIAAIGNLPPTLEDRSVKVPMRRARRGEVSERLRPDRPPADVQRLQSQAARWAKDYLAALRGADPEMPSALHDRAQDVWRPLVAIADLVGGSWPARARRAALALASDGDQDSLGVELLRDIKAAFEKVDRLSSADLVARLIEDQERPWATIEHGKPLSQNKLARRLRHFNVKSKNVRLPDGSTPKGFDLTDFADAFSRYLPPESATAATALNSNGNSHFQSATRLELVAVQNDRRAAETLGCGGVAVQTPENASEEKNGETPF